MVNLEQSGTRIPDAWFIKSLYNSPHTVALSEGTIFDKQHAANMLKSAKLRKSWY